MDDWMVGAKSMNMKKNKLIKADDEAELIQMSKSFKCFECKVLMYSCLGLGCEQHRAI